MRLVRIFIWSGFIALLSVSIPKVAWIFRSYEGTPLLFSFQSVTIDVLWLIPLFVAICIDVLILTLTYAVSRDRVRASQVSMWLFVAVLCLLSCYCNLLYNESHMPTGIIWSNPLISGITPYIIACVPLFALCYTLILSRVNGEGETLDEKATRLENEKSAKERIRNTRQGAITNRVKQAISGVSDIASHVIHQLPKGDIQSDTPEILPETLNGHHQDSKPDTQKIFALPVLGYSEDTHQDIQETLPETLQETQKNHNDVSSIRPTIRPTKALYVSLEDASLQYHYSTEYLSKLVSTGKLRSKQGDRNQILVSSLTRYIDAHGRRKQ